MHARICSFMCITIFGSAHVLVLVAPASHKQHTRQISPQPYAHTHETTYYSPKIGYTVSDPFFSLFFFLYVFNDFRKKGIYDYFLHGNQKNLSFTIWGFAREMSRSELDCTLVTNPMNPKLCDCPLPGFVGISGVNMGEQPTIGWFCWDNYSIIIYIGQFTLFVGIVNTLTYYLPSCLVHPQVCVLTC